MSTHVLAAHRRQAVRAAGATGLVALFLGVLVAALISRSFARRMRAIANAAAAVAAGDLEQRPVADRSGDEIGVTARAFNAMVVKLRALIGRISEQARAESERLIEQRTGALRLGNQDMRLLLDNIEQGFLTADRDGVIHGARSAIVERWLGAPRAAETLWAYVGRSDADAGAWIEVCWDALSGSLPVEVGIMQLPSRFQRGDQQFSIQYTPICGADDALERLIIVIRDISADVQREEREAEERELLRVIGHIAEDRDGFADFLRDARAGVESLAAARDAMDSAAAAHRLHTLKGNCAIFGLDSLAARCHQLEDAAAESGVIPDAAALEEIGGGLDAVAARVAPLLSTRSRSMIEISEHEHWATIDAVSAGAPADAILARLASWRLEPLRHRLQRVATQAERMAANRGKGPLEVTVADADLRLDPKEWGGFWEAFVHIVRNAIEHGLETAIERERLGKRPARIVLRAEYDGASLRLSCSDNGRGVDWAAVRSKAAARGLPHEARSDLVAALFVDGLSTAGAISTMSGRGVGMGAVAAAASARGGHIDVHSGPGQGTTFLFSWPADRVTVVDPARGTMSAAGTARRRRASRLSAQRLR